MQQRRTVENVQHETTQAPLADLLTEDFWTRALAAVPQSAVPRYAWGGGARKHEEPLNFLSERARLPQTMQRVD